MKHPCTSLRVVLLARLRREATPPEEGKAGASGSTRVGHGSTAERVETKEKKFLLQRKRPVQDVPCGSPRSSGSRRTAGPALPSSACALVDEYLFQPSRFPSSSVAGCARVNILWATVPDFAGFGACSITPAPSDGMPLIVALLSGGFFATLVACSSHP